MKIDRKLFKEQRDSLSNVIAEWGSAEDEGQKEEAQLLEGLHDMLIEIDENLEIGGEAIIEDEKRLQSCG